jgi:hypothetical protein
MSTTREYNALSALHPKKLFSYTNLAKNLGYIFFLAGLAIIYIWNAHSAERNVREMNALNRELKELNHKHVTTQAELDNRSLESRVIDMVQPMGLKVSGELPKKLEEKE